MRLRASTAVLAAVLIVVSGCVGSRPAPDKTMAPPARTVLMANPLKGKVFYTDRDTQAHSMLEAAREGSNEQKALRIITSRPTATWLTGDINDAANVTRVTAGASHVPNSVALLAFYNQPHRDSCSGSSAGGAANKATFLRWNQQMIDAMQGNKTAVVVFAPDALAEIVTDCIKGQQATERIDMFAEAIKALVASPHVALTCIDAGHPGWGDAGDRQVMVDVLRQVGVDQTGCISLNVSNAYSNADNVAYLDKLNGLGQMAPTAALIDTSRNGGGTPPEGEWCNVPGRKLGPAPTTDTGAPDVYAYAYVKHPGQSDGNGKGCHPGDKPAGELDIKQVVSLARDEIE